MYLTSLLAILGLFMPMVASEQPPIVVEVNQAHEENTRYRFEYQDDIHILDLNGENEILVYYVENVAKKSTFLGTDEYDEKIRDMLAEQFSAERFSEKDSPEIEEERLLIRNRRWSGWFISHEESVTWSDPHYTITNSRCYSNVWETKVIVGVSIWSGFMPHVITKIHPTEIDPLSEECDNDNKRKILRYRSNPSLFFTRSRYDSLEDYRGLNFVKVEGHTVKWYLTDDYIASGKWLATDQGVLHQSKLATLLINHGALTLIDRDKLTGYLKILANSRISSFIHNLGITVGNEITLGLISADNGILIKAAIITAAKASSKAAIILGVVDAVMSIWSFSAANYEIAKLLEPSTYGQGWILTRTNLFNLFNLNTQVDARLW